MLYPSMSCFIIYKSIIVSYGHIWLSTTKLLKGNYIEHQSYSWNLLKKEPPYGEGERNTFCEEK